MCAHTYMCNPPRGGQGGVTCTHPDTRMHTHIQTHAHICARAHICTEACACTGACAHTHTCTHRHTHHTCTHARTRAYTQAHTSHLHAHVHTHAHTRRAHKGPTPRPHLPAVPPPPVIDSRGGDVCGAGRGPHLGAAGPGMRDPPPPQPDRTRGPDRGPDRGHAARAGARDPPAGPV